MNAVSGPRRPPAEIGLRGRRAGRPPSAASAAQVFAARRPDKALDRLTIAAATAAALPVIASTVRALAAGWQPIGDQGYIATRAYDVLTAHTPLVGGYSFASRAAGQPTYHAGPLLHWLLALPARTGAPASLALTMGTVNAASIFGAVLLARRRGGKVLMIASALAVASMCRSLSSENLHAIFNPAAGVLPFTLLIFLSWSLACGDYRLLPLTVLVASFVTQCHLGFLPPAAGLLTVGLIGLGASRGWFRGRARPPPGTTIGRWGAAALATALLCWSAPIVDQAAHRPGNLSLLATAASSRRATEGWAPGWRAVVRAVGIPPRWMRRPGIVADHVSVVSGGDYGDTRIEDVWSAPGLIATASSVLLLALLAAAAAAAARRGRRDLAAGAAIGLVLCAALAAVVAATPRDTATSLGYVIWWGSPAGMWVWLILGWSAVELTPLKPWLEKGPARRLMPVAGLATVFVAGAGVALAEKPDAHASDYRAVGELAAGFDRGVPPGRTVRLIARGNLMVRIGPAIDYALRRRNIRPLAPGASRLLTDRWYELDDHRYDYVLSVFEGAPPPARAGRVIARVQLTDSQGAHPITAVLSPPRAVQRFTSVR